MSILTVSLVFKLFSVHTPFPYYLLLWAVHLWCPLHRLVFTVSLNVFHLEYSFIVHLLFSLHCLTIIYCCLAFAHACIKILHFFYKKFSSTCSDLLFFNAFFSNTVSPFLQELDAKIGENTTTCNLGWSSEISGLLYYARNHFQDLRSKVLTILL